MERHVDARTCRQKQPTGDRERDPEGDTSGGGVEGHTQAIVRRTIVPVSKEDASPALIKRLKQESWPMPPARPGTTVKRGTPKADWREERHAGTPVVIECGSEPIIVNLGAHHRPPEFLLSSHSSFLFFLLIYSLKFLLHFLQIQYIFVGWFISLLRGK